MAAKDQFPHPFGMLAAKYRKLRGQLPLEVSNIAANEFKDNFKREGYRGDGGSTVKWKARKSKQKGSKRGILTKSGRLRRSIRPAPTGGDARVITDVPYAQAHNEGFEGTVSVKAHKRTRYAKVKEGTGVFSIKTRKEKKRTKKVKAGTGKVKAHRRRMNIPARPFMITTEPLMKDIEQHVFDKLDKLFK